MKLFLIILCLITLQNLFADDSLHEDAITFLVSLYSQGWTGCAIIPLELSLMEPCTLSMYLPEMAGGFIIGMGGDNMLDLELEIVGTDFSIRDAFPDDFPILEISPLESERVRYLVVTALDMIHGSRCENAYIMWALSPMLPDSV